MAIPKLIGTQRDFSSGEVDEALKRADEMSAMKTGARQLVNFRLLSGGQAKNRPGRRVLFLEPGRIEQVLMSPGNIFYLAFGDAYIRVYNAAGVLVAGTHVKGDGYTAIPWTAATAGSVTFAVVTSKTPQVYIAYGHDFPYNIPLILTWDGISQYSGWTIANFAESVLPTGQKRTLFTRLSPANVTLQPSAISGAIILYATPGSSVFTPGMVGTRILWCGRQVLITGYIAPTEAYATVIEQLPNSVMVNLGNFIDIGQGNSEFVPGQNGYFLPGDLVEGSISGARGIVIQSGATIGIAGTAQYLFYTQVPYVLVQPIPSTTTGAALPYYLETTVGSTSYFIWKENIVGANGNAQVGSTDLSAPQPVAVWDDEVMNNYRGWPASVFYDQNRLGFCGFAGSPSSIAWSASGLPSDFYVNGLATTVNADNAIFEDAPGDAQVYFVVPGMESSEFVFCSNAVYYIPITPSAPLTPGSVSFNLLTSQGSYPGIKPAQIQQSILYVRAGGQSIGAVQTPGYYWRPSVIDLASEFHSHLFGAAAPVALVAPQAPSQYEENYAYLLRADGTVVTTRYLIRNGLLEPGAEGKPKTGWHPWNGVGFTSWISAQGGDLIFTTTYLVQGQPFSSGFSNGFDGGAGQKITVIETLDNTQYLDCAVPVNALPPGLVPPGGKGPLWFLAGQEVTLIDQGTRIMGTYQIDLNGHLVPQFIGGENLLSPQLVAGQPWTAMIEPFAPDAPPGQSSGQRMKKRRVARMTVYVSNSNGFTLARLFSGPITQASPPLGTVMNFYRIPAWYMGDNVEAPPPLREAAYRWRPAGRSFDPRMAVMKDTPGPLLVHEIGMEITV